MSSKNLLKLDPNLYLEAARYIESGECWTTYHALYRAAYRLNDFDLPDLIRHITAWKNEFEKVNSPFIYMNDLNFSQEEKKNFLLRMAYIAEKNEIH